MVSPEYFYVGADPADARRLYWLPLAERSAHMAVWGSSGAGKSNLLLDMIGQDIMAGRGCALIDPKGDTFQDVLAALTATPEQGWGRLADDLIIVDPGDPSCTTAFNPLEVGSYSTPSRQRAEVLAVIHKVWKMDEAQAPRMGLVVRKSIQLAMENSLTLCDIPRLLTDADLRSRLVERSADELLRNFWQLEFPTSPSAQLQWTASTLTRLGTLIDDPAVRRLLGQGRSTFDFRKAMDEGRVILVNLSKGRLGTETAYLLGGFLLAKLQMAAESRQDIFPAETRRMFYVYLDEFQNYATRTFEEMLAEARGYGVSLVMANQNLGQLGAGLLEAVLSNARIRAPFRLSATDAASLHGEIWRFDGARVKETRWQTVRLGRASIPIPAPAYYTSGEEARQNREALHYLPDRHFWLHVQGEAAPVLLRSVDMPRDRLARARELVPRLKALAYPAPQEANRDTEGNLAASLERQRTYEWSRQ